MRPLAHFTLHAALATALIAFAATGAAAAAEQPYYTITFQEGRLAAAPPSSSTPPSAAPAPGSAVEKWQPAKPHAQESVSKVDGFTVKQGVTPVTVKLDRVYVKSWSSSGGVDASPKGLDVDWDVAEYRAGDGGNARPIGTSDLTMKRGTSPAAGAAPTVTVGGTRTEAIGGPIIGTAIGRAAGQPAKPYVPSSAAQGINRLIIVTTAAGGCTAGKRYPLATMAGGGKRYEFSDVTITGCGRSAGPEEQITFVYGKMVVK
jgi:hypothetical protein